MLELELAFELLEPFFEQDELLTLDLDLSLNRDYTLLLLIAVRRAKGAVGRKLAAQPSDRATESCYVWMPLGVFR